jgi:hypothetical protein
LKTFTRRVATLGAATLVLASAVLSGTAGAALAVAAPVVVAGASVVGSPPNASAVATCPAGTTLVGTGGRIEQAGGAGGNVVLTDIIPNVAAGTVTAWGNEFGVFAGNWSVVAYAVCDTVITGVVRVTTVTATNAASPKTVLPVCPANTQLTGLGYELQQANGNVFPDDMAPNPALNGARLTAYSSPGFAGNWQLTGYALCAPLPAGAAPAIVSTVTAANPAAPKNNLSGPCAAGTRLTGTGTELTGALGNVIADQVDPDAFALEAHSRGVEPAPYANPWSLTTYAICW